MMDNELVGNTVSAITSLSLTFIVVSSVFLMLASYAWLTSKGKTVSLAFGTIISSVLFTSLQDTGLFQRVFSESTQGFALNATVLAVLIVSVTYVINYFVHGSFASDSHARIVQIVLLTGLIEGVLFSIAYHVLDIKATYDFSSFADMLFGNEYSFLAWLAALIIGLFFIRNYR